MSAKTIRETFSVCPVCRARIPARQIRRGGEVRLEKVCPEHGRFEAVVWRGRPELEEWRGALPPVGPGENASCPTACGLCPEHRRGTCCVLLEITARCNLRCAHCFADGGAPGAAPAEPTLDELAAWFAALAEAGNTFVQLSGGEPTLREDLPEIVRLAKSSGMEYVQLNTNGLRLADDPALLDALAEAGLSFVFLQFDGLDNRVYQSLRGAPLLERKKKVIAACGERRVGVTLVPTLVPGVNTRQIWKIVEFGAALSPAVRGVHFQPVSYFGRYPQAPSDEMRVTLPEVIAALENQSFGALRAAWFAPSRCDHPQCGFHADFLALPGQGLRPLRPEGAASRNCCCAEEDAALKNRHYVGRRWSRRDEPEGAEPPESGFPPQAAGPYPGGPDLLKPAAPGPNAPGPNAYRPNAYRPNAHGPEAFKSAASGFAAPKPGSLDDFLQKTRRHLFTISAMAFQDLWTLDLERLRQCSLHVYDHGRLVPFCSYYNLSRRG